jgi:hypothetical protein
MKTLAIALSFILSIGTAGLATAHDARKGPHGGQLVDAGARHHVELVTNGSTTVVLHLYDASDRPVPAEGFRGNAILSVQGQVVRFALQPEHDNRLVGPAPMPIPDGVKGVIQLVVPGGATAQARF